MIKHISFYSVIIILLSFLMLLILWQRVVYTVGAGEGGVLFKRFYGTVIDKVYLEGVHLIYPWDVFTKYNLRIQELKHTLEILTKQGLAIDIKVSIRFKPDVNMLGLLHQKIGPNYIEAIVIPEVEAVIRKYFGQYTDYEIYTSKKAILKKILNESSEQLADKFIILDDLIIRAIEFPEIVEKAIESKINEFHRYKEYEYRVEREKLEAERKIIEAQGIRDYKLTVSEQGYPAGYLTFKGIEATLKLAESPNSKIILIGGEKDGLPILFNKEIDKEVK